MNTLTSPVKRFPGTVVLPDYLNLRQCRIFEDSLGTPEQILAKKEMLAVNPQGRVWVSVRDEERLPVILAIVMEWHLDGIPEHPTPATFPGTPRAATHQLIVWLYDACRDLWSAEETVPNE